MPTKSIEKIIVFELPQQALQGSRPKPFMLDARTFSFEMYRKKTRFGDTVIDQFWLDTRGLYGGRDGARRRETIVEFFRALCRLGGTNDDSGAQESYLMAKLVPITRRNGASRIFQHAIPIRQCRPGAPEIAQFERLLSDSVKDEMSAARFHRYTGKVLGCDDWGPETEAAYESFHTRLMDAGRAAMNTTGPGALEAAGKVWADLTRSVGRRRGHEEEKIALDILSYECRAALHRCYSAAWCELLGHIERKYGLSRASSQFHRVWHFDLQLPSTDYRRLCHLLHGHIPALHPIGSLLIRTETGKKLLGDHVSDANRRAFPCLLHALAVTADFYNESSRTTRTSRRRDRDVTKLPLDTQGQRHRSGRRFLKAGYGAE